MTFKEKWQKCELLWTMFTQVIRLRSKNIRYIQRQNRMIKTRKIKVKSIENEEIIMAMTIAKLIITTAIMKIIIIIMMIMRIKIGNCIKIQKC